MKTLRITGMLLGVFLMLGSSASTNTARAEEKGTQDLAKASQNPISTLISVPFELMALQARRGEMRDSARPPQCVFHCRL